MALARRRLSFWSAKAPGAGAVLAALPQAVLVVNAEGNIVAVNTAAETLFNTSEAHLTGLKLAAVVPLPVRFHEAQDASFVAYDVAIEVQRGISVRLDVACTPLPDPAGWRVLVLSGGSTGQRMDRRRSDHGNRSTEHIAAMLAHEIKNPLSGIRGAAQLLEKQSCDNSARAMTKLIRDEVDRIAALIDQMQGFTDTRAQPLDTQNIYAILEHVRTIAANGFARFCTIRDNYDPSLPAVLVHRDALIQVLLNLLKNAAEAVDRENGVITIVTAYRHGVSVSLEEGGGRMALPIEVSIIDNGPGPPPDMLDTLFMPFATSKPSGRGLGLALADKLMRDMGGMIQFVREDSPPRTIFRLMLPRAGNKA
ncbi:MAG: PAS domain-containing protein [Alphaproteobacteria bacterium]|nr:PAS domain-containing protein [Alphaproteobacteria bacterium]MDE2041798.1 PAS domain-containing protein [Alphaproteobacteria bacterium]MDE2340875.1 PAS domain-containing protein [Alphaproteobacteria bacterium]